jgi:predicted transcriptional regulator
VQRNQFDSAMTCSYASHMDLQLPERQATELASLSSRTGRTSDDLVVEAVDRLLAQERWLDEQIQLGIDQIARGEFLEEEEMDARVARLMQP